MQNEARSWALNLVRPGVVGVVRTAIGQTRDIVSALRADLAEKRWSEHPRHGPSLADQLSFHQNVLVELEQLEGSI